MLTGPTPDHAADIYRYARNERFCAYIDAAPARSAADATAFLKGLANDNAAGARLYWVAVRRNDDRAVGTIGFVFTHARRHRVAELGYGFSPETWGTGLFQEAAAEVLRYAFANLGLVRIHAITRADNVAAIKGVEKVGLKREATLKSFYETDEGRADAAVMAILISEYARREERLTKQRC